MDEFEIIRRYFTRPNQDQSVLTGIGDDGAVLAPPDGRQLVAVVDTIIAGVHFPHELAAADIGYRSLAVNLSDILAMGAAPRWMTVALTLAEEHADDEWLQPFADGLFSGCDSAGVSLVGGDTTRGRELVISVQLIGTVEADSVLRRATAHAGDLIFVTGHPGDAAAGLHLMQQDGGGDAAAALIARFARPQPPLALGAKLSKMASAAIDISDGLFADLGKLLQASQVAGQIELQDLSLSQELEALFDRSRRIAFALSGGDDYQLCFTAPANYREQLLALSAASGVLLTEIGKIVEGEGLSCTDGGKAFDFSDDGYRHFHGAAQP